MKTIIQLGQKVHIPNLKHYGSVFTSNIVVLGESDLIYTQTVCAIGKESYKDKEVLILGGGDGGILHELLKVLLILF